MVNPTEPGAPPAGPSRPRTDLAAFQRNFFNGIARQRAANAQNDPREAQRRAILLNIAKNMFSGDTSTSDESSFNSTAASFTGPQSKHRTSTPIVHRNGGDPQEQVSEVTESKRKSNSPVIDHVTEWKKRRATVLNGSRISLHSHSLPKLPIFGSSAAPSTSSAFGAFDSPTSPYTPNTHRNISLSQSLFNASSRLRFADSNLTRPNYTTSSLLGLGDDHEVEVQVRDVRFKISPKKKVQPRLSLMGPEEKSMRASTSSRRRRSSSTASATPIVEEPESEDDDERVKVDKSHEYINENSGEVQEDGEESKNDQNDDAESEDQHSDVEDDNSDQHSDVEDANSDQRSHVEDDSEHEQQQPELENGVDDDENDDEPVYYDSGSEKGQQTNGYVSESAESVTTRIFNDDQFIKSLVDYNVTLEDNEFLSEGEDNDKDEKEGEEVLQNGDLDDHQDEDVDLTDSNAQHDKETDQEPEEDLQDSSGSPNHEDLVSDAESDEEEQLVENQNKLVADYSDVDEDEEVAQPEAENVSDDEEEDNQGNQNQVHDSDPDSYVDHHDDQDEPPMSPEVLVNISSPACQDLYNESFQVEDNDDSMMQPEMEPESEPEPETTEATRILKRKKVSRDSLKRRIFANLDEGRRPDDIIRPADNSLARIYRRSKRNRVRPLNYWSGQRPLYKYEDDQRGNAVSTLVGVSTESMEPRRLRRVGPGGVGRKKGPVKNRPERPEDEQKMANILDLSIHNSKLAKRLKEIDTEAENDSNFILAYCNVDFKESSNSPGVFTAITKKISNIAFGKLKFAPNAEKKKTRTGAYITHFNVIYGTLLLKIEGDKAGSVVKTGFYFQIDQQTNYSISNLRNDEAMIDFTIIKDSP